MFHELIDPLLSIVYPQSCRCCGSSVETYKNGIACSPCWDATRIFSGRETLCAKCGAFQENGRTGDEVRCRQCEDSFFDRAVAAGIYERALAASVLNLKKIPHLPHRVRRVFLSALQRADLAETNVILPIPLSRKRHLERGFNQAEVLATIAAGELGLPMIKNALARKIHTPVHRVAMDNKARDLSVHNAFEVRFPRLVRDRNIVLIDDVFTSGATVSNCAKVLKKNGAAKVNVLTLARAVMY